MKWKDFLIFVLLCFWSNIFINAQSTDFTVAVPSPNAASLGQYAEIPVSYFTGVPDISIPIYSVKGRRLELPVTLSYHASGLRPDMHPGWIGEGWSLFAGGVITRKINGFIDEYKKSFSGSWGYYFNCTNLNNANWSSNATIAQNAVVFTPVLHDDPFPQSTDVDVEPDEFDFNFLGYSGKFFMDQTGNWQVQCDKAIKISFNPADFVNPFIQNVTGLGIDNQDVSKTFGRFTLTDENGNKYIFGSVDANNSAIEFSDIMIPQTGMLGASITATSWYLTQIVSADNSETINLSYERGPLTSYIGYEFSQSHIQASAGGGFLSPPCTWSTSNFSGLNGRVLFPVYLTSISMPSQYMNIDFTSKSKSSELTYIRNGNVSGAYAQVYNDAGISTSPPPSGFPSVYLNITSSSIIPYYTSNTPDPSLWNRFIWMKLDAIKIKNTVNNNVVRTINFNYNNDPTKRLQLNSLNFKDINNLGVETYSFSYNATALPAYISIYGDSWGFNNYSNNGTLNNLLPLVGGVTVSDYSIVRAPDPTGVQTQAEILTSITYPTGGSSSFLYEPNSYRSIIYRNNGNGTILTTESGLTGGVRINQITNTDNFGNVLKKNYFYVNGYVFGSNPSGLPSSGIVDSKPIYTFNCSGNDNQGLAFYYQLMCSSPVVPVSFNTAGSYIGYSSVVERRSDGSYSLYQFTNHDNGYGDLPAVNSYNKFLGPYFPCNSQWYQRGKLIHKSDFNNTGNIVNENIIAYGNIGSPLTANAIYSFATTICNSRGYFSRIAYQFNYAPFLPVTNTNTTYSNNGSSNFISTVTSFSYNTNKLVTSKTETTSKNESLVTTYKYPPDETDATSIAMTAAHLLCPIIETTIKKNGTQLNYTHTNYYTPFTGVFVPQNIQMQIASFPLETRQQYYQYDALGNVQEQSRTNDVHEVYLWGYNSQFIVAKISGSTYSAVQAAMTAAGITQAQLDAAASSPDVNVRSLLNGIRTRLPGVFVTTYTYAPLSGMTSETDPNGKITYYEYDTFQRLSLIRDNNNNIIKTFQYNFQNH